MLLDISHFLSKKSENLNGVVYKTAATRSV